MAEPKVLIDNKQVALSDTKVVFGALKSPTPQWVKTTINVTILITSAVTIFIAGTNVIPEGVKFECMLGIKAIDGLVVGLGKMFGVVEKDA